MSLEAMVRKLGRHAGLEDDDRRALAELPFTKRRVNMGHHLVKEGDLAFEHVVLLAGYAHQHKIASAGGRQIVAIRMPGDAISWSCLFFDRVDYSAQALTAVEAAVIHRTVIRDLIGSRPAIGRAILMATLVDAAISSEWLLNMGRRTAKERLAHLLCELASRIDATSPTLSKKYQIPLTQEQMGDILGLTAVHVNRMMKQLAEDGLILRDGRYLSFPRRDRLVRLADFNDKYLNI